VSEYSRTFAIKITCDHEPGDHEEDKVLRYLGDGIEDLIEDLRAAFPEGWHAEEADEVEP